MLESGKTLGQFITGVLQVVSTAAYVPASIFSASIILAGLLTVSDADNPVSAVAESVSPSFGEIAFFILLVVLTASLIDPLQFKITRFFEGQGSRTPWSQKRAFEEARQTLQEEFSTLYKERKELKENKSENLDRLSKIDSLQRVNALKRQGFPANDRILAYKLGNIVRAYEDRATVELQRSGLPVPGGGEIQDLIPFAYFAIPKLTRMEHDQARTQMQSLCTLTVMTPVSALVVAVALLRFDWGWAWGLAVFAASLIVAFAAHAGAKDAGESYGAMLLAIAQQFSFQAFDVEVDEEVEEEEGAEAA